MYLRESFFMSRPGITYQDVANAAHQLSAQDINPTIEAIRKITGTGSNGTLALHLRKWKEIQSGTLKIASKENLPGELVSLLKGLWDRVITQSEERVVSIEESYQQELTELKQELEKYKANNQRWQKLFTQWQQEQTQLSNEKLTLEQAVERAHKENVSLQARLDTLLQQLQEKSERIDELHQLHKQAQENLEHYRESAREQRLIDQQQHEQQRQFLQTEIKTLKEQSSLQRDKMSALQATTSSTYSCSFYFRKKLREKASAA